MPAPVVWFNKYLGNTGAVVRRVRRERRPGEFRVLVTHPRPQPCAPGGPRIHPRGLARMAFPHGESKLAQKIASPVSPVCIS